MYLAPRYYFLDEPLLGNQMLAVEVSRAVVFAFGK